MTSTSVVMTSRSCIPTPDLWPLFLFDSGEFIMFKFMGKLRTQDAPVTAAAPFSLVPKSAESGSFAKLKSDFPVSRARLSDRLSLTPPERFMIDERRRVAWSFAAP